MRNNKHNGYNNANLTMETLILPEKIEENWVVFDEEKFLKSLPDGMQYYAIDEKNETIYGLGKDYNKRIEKLEDELFVEKRHHEKVAKELLNYKDKVSKLGAKLAEKDLRIEELESQFAYECECNKQFVECQKENAKLKQVVETIDKLKQYDLDMGDYCLISQKQAEQYFIDSIQDKIDLLEKVESYIQDCTYIKEPDYTNVCEYINTLIKEIKGE